MCRISYLYLIYSPLFLLSILSLRYIDSEWCLREVDEFCRTAELNGGLTVDDKARVIRIMLRGIPAERREQLPHVLKDALGYEFFQWCYDCSQTDLDRLLHESSAFKKGATPTSLRAFISSRVAIR